MVDFALDKYVIRNVADVLNEVISAQATLDRVFFSPMTKRHVRASVHMLA